MRCGENLAARPAPERDVIPAGRQENPRFSYDTEKDHRFADFLREKSGGMVRQAAVGVEREGNYESRSTNQYLPTRHCR